MLTIKLRITFFVLLSAIIFSCSEEAETDTQVPTINFEQESQEKFMGVIALDFQASDNEGLSEIKVYLNGSLIAERKFTSTNEAFTFEWDSKVVEDGNHELKIVVTDLNGNNTEKIYEIVVDNILMSVFVPENYFKDEAFWMFVSDHKGNLLGVQQAQNNSTVEFPAVEGFNEESVMLHLFTYENRITEFGQEITDRLIRTMVNVSAGKLFLVGRPEAQQQGLGSVNINITEMLPGYKDYTSSIGYFTSNGQYVNETNYSLNTTIPMVGEHEVFIAMYHLDGSAKCKLLNGVAAGEEHSVSFNEFGDMNKSVIQKTGVGFAFHFDVGFRTNNPNGPGFVYNNYPFHFIDPPTNELWVYSPVEKVFDSYTSVSMEALGNEDFYYVTRGDAPHSEFKRSQTELVSSDFSDGNIKMELKNPGDYMQLSLGKNYGTGSISFSDYWVVTMQQQSTIDFKLPDIPVELIELYYPQGIDYPLNELYLRKSVPSIPYSNILSLTINETGIAPEVILEDEVIEKVINFNDNSGGRQSEERNQIPSIRHSFAGANYF